MSSSSQQNSVLQPVPNNNGAECPLPWSWMCKRVVPIWSDPSNPLSTVRIHRVAAESAKYKVVRQYAPPPPPPPERQRDPDPRSGR
ncbi:hypothetical protein BHYA_0266g00120 [Botrytis hyacinthi]|uniref:Uncharacterized protein n=1 Tax=Botrytis hyacinthi TaxID=278943 RepID=A0A4Z1GDG6_9HELO|nr:hypothetical protein BHYA_0266g00120 [Botrytis hyacinthi]